MPQNKEQLPNRRHEERMPLQGLVLKIRKAGIGNSLQQYETCRSVDLSLNGLAFATDTLSLQIPEKISFMLILEGHEIKGNGVICNKRTTQLETQYGLMFLSVSPEINTVFNCGELTTQELERLSENLAEQYVYSLWEQTNPQNKQLWLKQQQLFDACRSYLIRLGEMGIRMTAYQASEHRIAPVQAVKIYRDNHTALILRWQSTDSKSDKQICVKLQKYGSTVSFLVNDESHFKTVLQVMEFLGESIKNDVRLI